MTNVWEHGADKEIADGKRLMDAVKAAGVKAIYWSGLPSVSEISGGRYTHVEHFDSKATVHKYAIDIGIPIVDVQPAMYMENYLTMMPPRKQDDGTYLFALPVDPKNKLSLIHCARDYGAYVRGAIESEMTSGKVLACGDEITPSELAELWSKGTGKKSTYQYVPPSVFQTQAGEEMTQMFSWFNDFGYYGGEDVKKSQKVLSPQESVQSWSDFVVASDWTKALS